MQVVTHVAMVEPDSSKPLVASGSQNTTSLDYLPPGTGLVQLVSDAMQATANPSHPISFHLPNSSFSELVVYQKSLNLSTPETATTLPISRQFSLSSLCGSSTLPFWIAISTASACALRIVLRKGDKPENRVEVRTKSAPKRRRARASRRNERLVDGQNTLKESAMRPQPSLNELDGHVPQLTDDIAKGPSGQAVAVVHDANKRDLLEVLRIPAYLRQQRRLIRSSALRSTQANRGGTHRRQRG